jgi:uncharacterized protein YjbI with pentapeptide repeats
LRNADFNGMDLHDADLRRADLSRANLKEANLTDANLTGANVTEANLTDANLTGADLTGANLTDGNLTRVDLGGMDLTGADVSGVNLTDTNLTGADLTGADLTGAYLRGANLTDGNLTGAYLSGVNLTDTNLTGANVTEAYLTDANLTGADLTGADLTYANLTEANVTEANVTGTDLTRAYLTGANLTGANLTDANLTGAYLTGANLTGANLTRVDLGGIDLEGMDRNLDENFIKIKESGNYSGVTSFNFSEDAHYLTEKSGILNELQNQESKIVLDLSNDPKFNVHGEGGLLSVVSNNKFIYISYTIDAPDGDKYKTYLVVDEYSRTFEKVRNIVQIGMMTSHFSGTLVFDSLGKLYLSVGDGGGGSENAAQDLRSLRGKVLRFDVSKTNSIAEIVAYGLRNPWKISIDSKNRMFIGDCGHGRIESVYLLHDLYPTTPYNLGWPVFEGTERRKEDPLTFQDTLAPIYEYRHSAGVASCVIGGFFLDEPEVYLFGDFVGNLRLLRKQKDGKWYEIHFQRVETNIWSFGYDEKDNKLFISGPSNSFELTIPHEQINFLPQVRLCRTTMPDGIVNNSSC